MVYLQCEDLLELLKERLSFCHAVTLALKLGHKRELSVHAPLAFNHVPFSKPEMFACHVSIDERVHNA
jgi:hypothetical protein